TRAVGGPVPRVRAGNTLALPPPGGGPLRTSRRRDAAGGYSIRYANRDRRKASPVVREFLTLNRVAALLLPHQSAPDRISFPSGHEIIQSFMSVLSVADVGAGRGCVLPPQGYQAYRHSPPGPAAKEFTIKRLLATLSVALAQFGRRPGCSRHARG